MVHIGNRQTETEQVTNVCANMIWWCAFNTHAFILHFIPCATMKPVQVHFYSRLWYQYIHTSISIPLSNTYIRNIFGCIAALNAYRKHTTRCAILQHAVQDARMYLCSEIGCIVTWIRAHNNSWLLLVLLLLVPRIFLSTFRTTIAALGTEWTDSVHCVCMWVWFFGVCCCVVAWKEQNI